MPIIRDGNGKILYVLPSNFEQDLNTFTFSEDDFAIRDALNVLKQIKFKVNPLTTGAGTLTIVVDVDADANYYLNSGSANASFSIMQPISGTSPTATIAGDTLNFTSDNGTVQIIGNSGTKTLNFRAAASTSFADEFYVTTGDITSVPFTSILVGDILDVYLNGILMREGASYDFQRNTGTNSLDFNYTIPTTNTIRKRRWNL